MTKKQLENKIDKLERKIDELDEDADRYYRIGELHSYHETADKINELVHELSMLRYELHHKKKGDK